MNAAKHPAGVGQEGSRRDIIVRALLQAILLPFFVAPFLFLPAWRLDWARGWALIAVYVLGMAATALLVTVRDPGLARERVEQHADAKAWDKAITSLTKLLMIAALLPIAGFDERLKWSPALPTAVPWAALALFALGYALIGWAMASNKFFGALVRIQQERGHTVAAGGPYRYVRHPGYLGMIVQMLAAPLALGSLWALAPGAAAAGLYVLRTVLEDRTLQAELAGYEDYARAVRYRLLPGIW